ncbi:MAG: hypothetical protein ACLVIY_00100 [Anaerobutyricum soehngenii]
MCSAEKKEERSTTATESRRRAQNFFQKGIQAAVIQSDAQTETYNRKHEEECVWYIWSYRSEQEDTDSSTSGSHPEIPLLSNEEGTTQKKAKKDISSREDAEIRTKPVLRRLRIELSRGKTRRTEAMKRVRLSRKIANDTRLAMKE